MEEGAYTLPLPGLSRKRKGDLPKVICKMEMSQLSSAWFIRQWVSDQAGSEVRHNQIHSATRHLRDLRFRISKMPTSYGCCERWMRQDVVVLGP